MFTLQHFEPDFTGFTKLNSDKQIKWTISMNSTGQTAQALVRQHQHNASF